MSRLSHVLAVGWEAQRKVALQRPKGKNTDVIFDDTDLDADALSSMFKQLQIDNEDLFFVRLRNQVAHMLKLEKVSQTTKDIINEMWSRIAEQFNIPTALPDDNLFYPGVYAADARTRVIGWTKRTTIKSEEEGEEEEGEEEEVSELEWESDDESDNAGQDVQETYLERYDKLCKTVQKLTLDTLKIMEQVCENLLEEGGEPTEETKAKMKGPRECLQFLANHNDLFHTNAHSVPTLLIPRIMETVLKCRPFQSELFDKLVMKLSENNRKVQITGPCLNKSSWHKKLLEAAMKGSLEALTRLVKEMPDAKSNAINDSIVLLARSNPMPHNPSQDRIPHDTRSKLLLILTTLDNWKLGDRFDEFRQSMYQEGPRRVWSRIKNYHYLHDPVDQELAEHFTDTAKHGLDLLRKLVDYDTRIPHDTSEFVELFAEQWLIRLGIQTWSEMDLELLVKDVVKVGKLSMLQVLFRLPWDSPTEFLARVVELLKVAAVRTQDDGAMFEWLIFHEDIRHATAQSISRAIVNWHACHHDVTVNEQ